MPAAIPAEKFEQHFKSKLRLDVETGCHEWTGGKIKTGYGRLRWKERNHLTHRVAFTLAKGEIPEGLYVLHRCDNPSCCNPDHLFLGDQFQNMADMISKGRQHNRLGSKNSCAKLTEDDVREIRRLKADGVKQVRLAERFGVSTVAISLIVLRKKWVHVS